MKAARSSRSVRAMRLLWVLEVVLLMLAVTGGVWLRFLGDNVGRDAYIQTAPLRSLVVALVMTMATRPVLNSSVVLPSWFMASRTSLRATRRERRGWPDGRRRTT